MTKPSLLRVVDVETTGIDDGAQVCEIGWIDIVDRKIVTEPKSTLVRIDGDIPPEASAVHHIISEDLTGAPTLSEALDPVMGADVYVAHHAAFDRRFLDAPLACSYWICTYKAALRAWPDAPAHNNQALRYWRGLCLSPEERSAPAHRAAADVYVTAHLLLDLLTATSPENIWQWMREPTLLPTVNFGKHKGAKWEDVPTDYLRWITTEATEMTPERIETATYHLEKRGRK